MKKMSVLFDDLNDHLMNARALADALCNQDEDVRSSPTLCIALRSC